MESTGSIRGSLLYELRGVTRTFTKGSVAVNALRGVDLDINRGEMLVLEGPSGSGIERVGPSREVGGKRFSVLERLVRCNRAGQAECNGTRCR